MTVAPPTDRLADDHLEARLAGIARSLSPTIAAHRRDLHRIPELAFLERETSAYLQAELTRLGIPFRSGIAGTGILAELPGGGPGPAVLLRADMDGLPIDEDPAHIVRSERPGRMHACGHDGHMAIVLGAAHALSTLRDEPLPGRVLLLFQPGEERGAGAQKVVESGVLDEFGVDYAIGLHLWSYLPIGTAIVPPGPVMASADEFDLVVRGAGGHAAMPHKASDVVLAASQFVVALQQVVARNVDPIRPAVVSVGKLRAGEASNVLPDRAEIAGTFRTADLETRGLVMHRIGELAEAVAKAHGVQVDIDFGVGYPPTVNDPRVAAVVQQAAAAVLGPANVQPGPMTMAAEDFSYLLQARPGVMFLLGMRDEARGLVAPHHSPQFQVAEEVLPQGLEIMLRAAARLMQGAAR